LSLPVGRIFSAVGRPVEPVLLNFGHRGAHAHDGEARKRRMTIDSAHQRYARSRSKSRRAMLAESIDHLDPMIAV